MCNVCSRVGIAASRRGDVIRCTVLFEDKQERGGKVQVPVVFSVNGSTIIPEGDQTFIEYSPDEPLYPCVAFAHENSVLAKVKKKYTLVTELRKTVCSLRGRSVGTDLHEQPRSSSVLGKIITVNHWLDVLSQQMTLSNIK